MQSCLAENQSAFNTSTDTGAKLAESIAWQAFLNKMLELVNAADTSPSSLAPAFCRNLQHWGNALPFPTKARFDDHINSIKDHYMMAEIYQVLMHGHLSLAAELQWLFVALHTHVRARSVLELALNASYLQSTQPFPEYGECFLKEVLRKYPACGNSTTRAVIAEDAELAGCPVLRGTAVRVNIYALQNTAKIWEHPQEFIPERWMHSKAKERFGIAQTAPSSCPFYKSPQTAHNGGDGSVYSGCGSSDHKLSFLPFSAGARTCLGKNLALKVLRRVLFDVASSFRLDPLPVHQKPAQQGQHRWESLSLSERALVAGEAEEGKEAARSADTDRDRDKHEELCRLDPGKSVRGMILPMHRQNTLLRVSPAVVSSEQ